MKKILIITLLAVFSLNVFAQTASLGPKEVLELLLKDNLDLQISALNSAAAYQSYTQSLAAEKPRVSFATDTASAPFFGYSNSVEQYIARGLPAAEVKTLSAGLSASGPLPGGATASLSVLNSTRIITGDNDFITLEQAPLISLSLSQPLFVNGRFMDTGAASLNRRLGQIGWDRAVLNERELKNRLILNSLLLLNQVVSLRETLGYLEAQLDLFNLELLKGRENRNLGRISETDLLALELKKGRQERIIFDTRYQLAVAEFTLAGSLGLDGLGPLKPEWNISAGNNPIPADPLKNGELHPALTAAYMTLEERNIISRLNGLSEGITADINLRMAPLYPSGREASGNLSDSFKDLASEDAGFSVSLNLGLRFPLYTGGAVSARRERDRLLSESVRLNLEKEKRALRDNLNLILRNIDTLEEKILFLEEQAAYDRILLQKERERVSLGLATDLDVETVRVSLFSKENEKAAAERELLIRLLEYGYTGGGDLENLLMSFWGRT